MFEVPNSFLHNTEIVDEDIPEKLRLLEYKQLKMLIRNFHPDKIEMNDLNRNKCHYLNELLNRRKLGEQMKRRCITATRLNQEYEQRCRNAEDEIHKLRSNGETAPEDAPISASMNNKSPPITMPDATLLETMDTEITHANDYCRMRRKPRGRPKKGFKWAGAKEWGCYETVAIAFESPTAQTCNV